MTISCSSCNTVNPPSSKFCTNCGISLVLRCHECNAELERGVKFCQHCGANVLRSRVSHSKDGFVVNGEWYREDGEFVRKVTVDEMRSSFESLVGKKSFWGELFDSIAKKSLKIPSGCVCAVVENGIVDEILPPGTRTTVGWFDNFMKRQNDEMPLFYLIDRQPIPIFTNIEISVGNSIHNIHAMIQTHIVGSLSDKESLMVFIDRMIEGKDSLNRRDICSKIQSKIQQELKRSILKSGPNMQMAEQHVTQILNQSVGRSLGLHFTASITLEGTTKSLNLHLGQNKTPQVKICTHTDCGAEISAHVKFCTTCGSVQPTYGDGDKKTGIERPIISLDGQQVEFDILLQFYGSGSFSKESHDEIVDAMASAVARIVSQKNYVDIPKNFTNIEEEVKNTSGRISETLNLELTDVTVLDIRSKTHNWEMNTKAEMERVKKELEMNQEWLGVEHTKQELQRASFDLVRSQKKIQREHEFNLFKEEQQARLEQQAYELEIGRQSADLELQDRELRQDFLDREAHLDINNSTRETNTTIAIDEQQRIAARKISKEEHIDNLQLIDNEGEIDKRRQELRHQQEYTEIKQEEKLEQSAVQHQLNIQEQTGDFRRKQDYLDAESKSKISDVELQSHIKARNAEQDLEEREDNFNFELEEKRKQADYNRDEQSKESEFSRKQAFFEAQYALERELKLAEIEKDRAIGTSENAKNAAVAQAKVELLMQMLQENQQIKEDHNQEMRNAYKDQAQQARDMSQNAMNNMGQVATSRAGNPVGQPHTKPEQKNNQHGDKNEQMQQTPRSKSVRTYKSCVNCGTSLPQDAVHCSECGVKQ